MAMAPPDSWPVFCVNSPRANDALPSDIKTDLCPTAPRAAFPVKLDGAAGGRLARLEAAVEEHERPARDEQRRAMQREVAQASSTCGAPARSSKRRATLAADGRRTAPTAPTSRTAVARIVSSKVKHAVVVCTPVVSWSSAERPRDMLVRRSCRAAVRLLSEATEGCGTTAMGLAG
eukprot:1014152-Prymnesium_polylepis.1